MCNFFDVAVRLLGFLRFAWQTLEGGWEGLEGLRGELPLPLNLIILGIKVDWLKVDAVILFFDWLK